MCQASQCYKVISSGLDTGGTDLCFRQDTPEPERCQSVSGVWGSQYQSGKVDFELWSEIIMDGRIVNVSAGRVAARNIWCGGLRWCSPVSLCLSRPNSAVFVVNCYSRDIIIIPSGVCWCWQTGNDDEAWVMRVMRCHQHHYCHHCCQPPGHTQTPLCSHLVMRQ